LGARVDAYRLVGTTWQAFEPSTAAYDGSYDVAGLPTGTYRVKFSASGYAVRYYKGKADLATATNIAVSAGHTTPNIDASLPALPAITSFTPVSGITGSSVTITGSHFTGVTSVKFGTLTAAHTLVSDTQVKATVPNGLAAAAKISVTTAAGTATSAGTFTPTLSITGFTPVSGPAGTVITISGVGFIATSTVKINGTPATNVTYVSASRQLKATVPAGATTGRITVTNTAAPAGTVTSAGTFTRN
jgi:large repetitive protein